MIREQAGFAASWFTEHHFARDGCIDALPTSASCPIPTISTRPTPWPTHKATSSGVFATWRKAKFAKHFSVATQQIAD